MRKFTRPATVTEDVCVCVCACVCARVCVCVCVLKIGNMSAQSSDAQRKRSATNADTVRSLSLFVFVNNLSTALVT